MQLLHSCPVPSPEFASLSLLLGPETPLSASSSREAGPAASSTCLGETLTVASPYASSPPSSVTASLSELSGYLSDLYDAAEIYASEQARIAREEQEEADAAAKGIDKSPSQPSQLSERDVSEVLLAMLALSASREERELAAAVKKMDERDAAAAAGGAADKGPADSSEGEEKKDDDYRVRLDRTDGDRFGARIKFFVEDAFRHDLGDADRLTSGLMLFHPSASPGGVGLHYVVIIDRLVVRRCADLLLSRSGGLASPVTSPTSSAAKPAGGRTIVKGRSVSSGMGGSGRSFFSYSGGIHMEVKAAVLVVGVSGHPPALGSSALVRTLPSRFDDCVAVLSHLAATGADAAESKRYARTVLTALLLTDEEDVKTNEMADAELGRFGDDSQLWQGGTAIKSRRRGGSKYAGGGGALKQVAKFGFKAEKIRRRTAARVSVFGATLGGIGGGASNFDRSGTFRPTLIPTTASASSSADVARIVSEQMQILSLAETDMVIRPYERRQELVQASRNRRRRRGGRFGGLAGARGEASGMNLVPMDFVAFDYVPQNGVGAWSSAKKRGGPAAGMVSKPSKQDHGIPLNWRTGGDRGSRLLSASDVLDAKHQLRRAANQQHQHDDRSGGGGVVPTLLGPRRDTGQNAARRAGRLGRGPPSRTPPGGVRSIVPASLQPAPVDRAASAPTPPSSAPLTTSTRRHVIVDDKFLREGLVSTDSGGFPVAEGGLGEGYGDEGSVGSATRASFLDSSFAPPAPAPSKSSNRRVAYAQDKAPSSMTFDAFGAFGTNEGEGGLRDQAGEMVTDGDGFLSPRSEKSVVSMNQRPQLQRHRPQDRFLPRRGSGELGAISMDAVVDSSEAVVVLRESTHALAAPSSPVRQNATAPAATQPPPLPPPLPPPFSPLQQPSARLLVNVALNEDLSCSYRDSKIASCSVEGVVQVQVRTDADRFIPFALAVRDPAGHIRTVQENKKYAVDLSDEALEGPFAEDGGGENKKTDRKYIVSVPKAENYFPIMRYKCSSELRPVPIRVQTRVRLHGIFCRVALQISSNPANEEDLTDLTIIMAVPSNVRGETLTTSPSGGVWNASKRSVLWCVAELGDGEKFQLQAQFEMEKEGGDSEEGGEGGMPAPETTEKPSFPVLVRCQCMYAQLSDVELEVSDLPEVYPAEVTMKLARRFRLSHREKSK